MHKGKLTTRLESATDQARAQVKADKAAYLADVVRWFDSLSIETWRAFSRHFGDADKQPGDDDLIAAAWGKFPQDLERRGAALNQRMQGLGLEWGGE